MSYNDQDAMDEFFANMQNSESKRHWYVSHKDLAEKDRLRFEKSDRKASIVLDLHGVTANSAFAQYQQIITFAAQHHHRVLKIIHGVGMGIIKQELQLAISNSPEILLATNLHAGRLTRSALWIWLRPQQAAHHRL